MAGFLTGAALGGALSRLGRKGNSGGGENSVRIVIDGGQQEKAEALARGHGGILSDVGKLNNRLLYADFSFSKPRDAQRFRQSWLRRGGQALRNSVQSYGLDGSEQVKGESE